MYTLFRSGPLHSLVAIQAPALLLSLVIAGLFYKFHSFTLECAAFLLTWFAIDAALSCIRSLWPARAGAAPSG